MNTSCNSTLTNTASPTKHDVHEQSDTVITVTLRIIGQKKVTTKVTTLVTVHLNTCCVTPSRKLIQTNLHVFSDRFTHISASN